jgi:hypothetical protein
LPEATVSLRLIRDGAERTVKTRVGELPEDETAAASTSEDARRHLSMGSPSGA